MIKLKSLILEEFSENDFAKTLQSAYSVIFDIDIDQVKIIHNKKLWGGDIMNVYYSCNLVFNYKLKNYIVYHKFFFYKFPKHSWKQLKSDEWDDFLKTNAIIASKKLNRNDINHKDPCFDFSFSIYEYNETEGEKENHLGAKSNYRSIKDMIYDVKKIIDNPNDSSDNEEIPVSPVGPTNKLQPIHENEEEQIDRDKLFNNDYYLDDLAEQLGWKFDFNQNFWDFPYTLYHCSKEENKEAIIKFGILPKSDTRGITNRSTGPAIFTSMSEEEIESLKGSYGSVVFVINTKLMKKDGYMPDVEKEPEWERAHKLSFVLQKIDKKDTYPEQYVDSSDGVSDYTVIVRGKIPTKYLSIIED